MSVDQVDFSEFDIQTKERLNEIALEHLWEKHDDGDRLTVLDPDVETNTTHWMSCDESAAIPLEGWR